MHPAKLSIDHEGNKSLDFQVPLIPAGTQGVSGGGGKAALGLVRDRRTLRDEVGHGRVRDQCEQACPVGRYHERVDSRCQGGLEGGGGGACLRGGLLCLGGGCRQPTDVSNPPSAIGCTRMIRTCTA